MTLGLVLMCKDEATGIGDCLATLRSRISHWTVLDTGSQDGTQQIVRDALAGIPGQLVEEPFVDFGVSRSRAFELAHGTADWLIASDADMLWTLDEGWEPPQDVDALMVAMGSADFRYRLPLVLRGDQLWKSVGAVHEYSTLADGRAYTSAPTDAIRTSCPQGRSSAEKSRWHLSLLEAEIAADAGNSRAVFYAANTLRDLGDPRALAMYEKRMRMGGWDEEVFVAMLHHARLLPTWPARLQALIKAWEFRPQRLEPAYEIAKALNARGEHAAAYRFATVPIAVPPDNLFVEMAAYRFGLDFERSIAAWWVGRKDECRDLCDDLLGRDIPDDIRAQVEKNRALC